jgi:GT2 family glycosyltransferase
MMDVTVIIVNYNTKSLLRECLTSVYRETKEVKYEVFVVDNRSEDGSPDMVQEEFPMVNLIRNERNVGFAAGNNIAIKKGSGRYFLLLNPDTRLVNNTMKILVDYMDEHSDVGATGSMLLDQDMNVQTVCRKFSNFLNEIGELIPVLNRFQFDWMSRNYHPDRFDYRSTGETDYVQGACLMVRKEVVDTVGPLDERFFMYSEEEDWCFRIKKHGWKVMYVSSAIILHYIGMSTRQRSDEMFRELYHSKLKFFMKNRGHITAYLLRFTLMILMFIRIPYYYILPLLMKNKEEELKKYRKQSMLILQAMISSR